jgi:hypothetical protein
MDKSNCSGKTPRGHMYAFAPYGCVAQQRSQRATTRLTLVRHGVRLITGLRRSRPTGGLFRQMYPSQLEKLFLVVLKTRKGRTAFSLVHVSVASSFCRCVEFIHERDRKMVRQKDRQHHGAEHSF